MDQPRAACASVVCETVSAMDHPDFGLELAACYCESQEHLAQVKNLLDRTILRKRNNVDSGLNKDKSLENVENRLNPTPCVTLRTPADAEEEKYRQLLNYEDAPEYLQFNPYIRTGYRTFLTTRRCIESVFWWTNETINIWSHLFGFILFFTFTLYDLYLLQIHASVSDKIIMASLLFCFQVCMLLSTAYHTFSCKSEEGYHCLLSFDLFGIALSLYSIYMSGIYYAFWCNPYIQMFYLLSVTIIFVIAMALQIPKFKIDSNVKMMVFVMWAAYGVVPTLHWTIVMGGMANPMVQLLLPRVLGMYCISGLAFGIYITRIPERFFPGKVDYIGHSHQWWHIFVLIALYYWHNTGLLYVEYRLNHACADNLRLR